MQNALKTFTEYFPNRPPPQEERLKEILAFQAEYEAHDSYESKTKAIDNFLRSTSPEIGFFATMHYILQEPYECYYRIDLFDFFIFTYKNGFPQEYKEFALDPTFYEDLLSRTDYLEYVGILLREYADHHPAYPENLLRKMVEKIERMSNAELLRRFYLEDVNAFFELKNNGQIANAALTGNQLYLIKRAIRLLLNSFLIPIGSALSEGTLCLILFEWLLSLDPQKEKEDFQLAYDVAMSLINFIRDKDGLIILKKLKTVLISLIDLFRLQFTSQDTFKGHRNFVIVLEIIGPQALRDCIYSENCFKEISDILDRSPRINLFQVVYNLVRVNTLSSAIVFIQLLTEQFLINRKYEEIILLFQEIICPYLVPNLRVARYRAISMELCESYFFGLCKTGIYLPAGMFDSLLANLKFFVIEVYKNVEQKHWLVRYLDFIDSIAYLYQTEETREGIQRLGGYIAAIRKEFDYVISQEDFEAKLKVFMEGKVWDMSNEDLKHFGRRSAIDAEDPNFVRNENYKGIRNIGNTCYLASTMQALFMTDDFRLVLLEMYQKDGLLEEDQKAEAEAEAEAKAKAEAEAEAQKMEETKSGEVGPEKVEEEKKEEEATEKVEVPGTEQEKKEEKEEKEEKKENPEPENIEIPKATNGEKEGPEEEEKKVEIPKSDTVEQQKLEEEKKVEVPESRKVEQQGPEEEEKIVEMLTEKMETIKSLHTLEEEVKEEFGPKGLESLRSSNVLKETQRLFFRLACGKEYAVNPARFKEMLPDQFRLANEEQDTSEFLQIYLDQLEGILKSTPQKDLISNMFAGETLNTFECQECFHSRQKRTAFMNIGLNFPDKKSQYEELGDMIKTAFDADLGDDGAGIYCEHCQKNSSLTIQTTQITKLPPYLIMTFNRFYYDRGEQRGSKIFTFVNIDEIIDLKDIWKEQLALEAATYQLYAVVIHKGFTTEHGHYYAIVKSNENQDQWILINDSSAYSINPQVTLKMLFGNYEDDTPYLLLYRQNV